MRLLACVVEGEHEASLICGRGGRVTSVALACTCLLLGAIRGLHACPDELAKGKPWQATQGKQRHLFVCELTLTVTYGLASSCIWEVTRLISVQCE